MTIIILLVVFFLLFKSNAYAGAGGPSGIFSGIFGTSRTPCGNLIARAPAPGFRWNQGIIPSTPVIQPSISIQVPNATGQGRTGAGLSSAQGSTAAGTGGGGNLNTNATPAPTVLPGYAGLQPRSCDTLSCGYPKGQQPLDLLTPCVQREPTPALGTSDTVTPYTPPGNGSAGACTGLCYSFTTGVPCLPGYSGPAPVNVPCVPEPCYQIGA